jgi:type III secretion system FlhB-like substrate exporter
VRRAIALRYDEEVEAAPTVISAGEGSLAERIERAAFDYGIPVVRDVPLADALSELHVGDQIPEALYDAVAAVLNEVASPSSS